MNVECISIEDDVYITHLRHLWESFDDNQKKNIEDSIAFWQSKGTICSVYDFVKASFDRP